MIIVIAWNLLIRTVRSSLPAGDAIIVNYTGWGTIGPMLIRKTGILAVITALVMLTGCSAMLIGEGAAKSPPIGADSRGSAQVAVDDALEATVASAIAANSTLRATHRPDGTWSTAQLLPPPKFGCSTPKIVIEGGSIEIVDPLGTHTAAFLLRDVNLTVAPLEEASTPGATCRTRTVRAPLHTHGWDPSSVRLFVLS